MSMDLTGITNKNEYYTNHYFSTVFEENTRATISGWNAAARESEEIKTPWSLLRQNARQYYTAHDKFVRSSVNLQVLANIKALVGNYLKSLGYPEAKPEVVAVDDSLSVPVYLEMTKSNGAPLLWVLLSASKESDNSFGDVSHALSALAELLPTAISILIGFTVMLITLLLTSSGESIDRLKKIANDKELHGKKITLYQGLHIQFSHSLFAEIFLLLIVFFYLFLHGLGWLGRKKVIFLGVEIYLTLNILLSILRGIANLYFSFYKNTAK